MIDKAEIPGRLFCSRVPDLVPDCKHCCGPKHPKPSKASSAKHFCSLGLLIRKRTRSTMAVNGMAAMSASMDALAKHTFDRYPAGDSDVSFDIHYCGICHTVCRARDNPTTYVAASASDARAMARPFPSS